MIVIIGIIILYFDIFVLIWFDFDVACIGLPFSRFLLRCLIVYNSVSIVEVGRCRLRAINWGLNISIFDDQFKKIQKKKLIN